MENIKKNNEQEIRLFKILYFFNIGLIYLILMAFNARLNYLIFTEIINTHTLMSVNMFIASITLFVALDLKNALSFFVVNLLSTIAVIYFYWDYISIYRFNFIGVGGI